VPPSVRHLTLYRVGARTESDAPRRIWRQACLHPRVEAFGIASGHGRALVANKVITPEVVDVGECPLDAMSGSYPDHWGEAGYTGRMVAVVKGGSRQRWQSSKLIGCRPYLRCGSGNPCAGFPQREQ
jgi:hypothetical protein